MRLRYRQTDREAVDYIENPSDLMDLGKDTGRLDGELAGSRGSGGRGDGDDEQGEDGEKNNGKKLRMSLQKGEVRFQRVFLHHAAF
jgi:hypothetical protein